MKNDWELSFGTFPGLLFGVRSYVEDYKTNHVIYILFVDICLTIYKLKKLSPTPIDGLILDLRNNPGGVLGAAVGITDLFLQEGKIVYTNGRTMNSKLDISDKS